MNRGAIPGFYFDEEKKKYFKIQANHLVPQGAKYSKGKVQQENRKSKKRKLEDRKQAIRHQHTVKRNPILHNPIVGGIGLSREHGTYSTSESLGQSDAAFVSQLRPRRAKVNFTDATYRGWPVSYARYLPSTQQMVTGSVDPNGARDVLHISKWNWNRSEHNIFSGSEAMVFHPTITSLSTAIHNDVPMVVFISTRNNVSELFMCSVPTTGSISSPVFFRSSVGLLASSINHTTHTTAVLSASTVFVVDTGASIVNRLPPADEKEYGPSIDWLSPSTVAYCCNSTNTDGNRVMLWDTRTKNGTSARFSVRSKITGVFNPSPANCNSAGQLLVSSNHRINLFDTRMPHSVTKRDNPLLSFPHVHQGPQLDFTTNERGLIAAVDRDNVVQIYSTRSGRCMGSLAASDLGMRRSESRMMKQLQWYEDERAGSALQACLGSGIIRWTWSGGMGDEEW